MDEQNREPVLRIGIEAMPYLLESILTEPKVLRRLLEAPEVLEHVAWKCRTGWEADTCVVASGGRVERRTCTWGLAPHHGLELSRVCSNIVEFRVVGVREGDDLPLGAFDDVVVEYKRELLGVPNADPE